MEIRHNAVRLSLAVFLELTNVEDFNNVGVMNFRQQSRLQPATLPRDLRAMCRLESLSQPR